jgi:hypothetical protein
MSYHDTLSWHGGRTSGAKAGAQSRRPSGANEFVRFRFVDSAIFPGMLIRDVMQGGHAAGGQEFRPRRTQFAGEGARATHAVDLGWVADLCH